MSNSPTHPWPRQPGEDTIVWWHVFDTGFAGRQPL
jgi:hypothetical protein